MEFTIPIKFILYKNSESDTYPSVGVKYIIHDLSSLAYLMVGKE